MLPLSSTEMVFDEQFPVAKSLAGGKLQVAVGFSHSYAQECLCSGTISRTNFVCNCWFAFLSLFAQVWLSYRLRRLPSLPFDCIVVVVWASNWHQDGSYRRSGIFYYFKEHFLL